MAFIKPHVGDRGAYNIGSDTYPITCIEVSPSGKTIKYRLENFRGDTENGHDYFGAQKWIIEENPIGPVCIGKWCPSVNAFRPKGQGCGYIRFNGWHAHQDPSF